MKLPVACGFVFVVGCVYINPSQRDTAPRVTGSRNAGGHKRLANHFKAVKTVRVCECSGLFTGNLLYFHGCFTLVIRRNVTATVWCVCCVRRLFENSIA